MAVVSTDQKATRMGQTFCEACDNVVAETRKRNPNSWLCSKFPRVEGQGFVAPNWWAENEPFQRCVNINGGACPLFEPRRELTE